MERPDERDPSPARAARAYRARGWSPVPVEPRGKRPLVPWVALQQRPASERQVEAWFRRWPDANVGIVTGRVSGLVVLDVDPHHGGSESLARLESRHAPLAPTIAAATGGGGRHLYFAHPGGLVPNKVGIERGLDLRGDGGFVVAPPSLHPSGERYAWLAGREPGTMTLASPPEWLVRAVTGTSLGHPLAHWRTLVREGVDEGERNDTIASLTGHLLWHGVDPVVVLDLLLAWNARRCRPPLSEDEVARTVESIVRLHRRSVPG